MVNRLYKKIPVNKNRRKGLKIRTIHTTVTQFADWKASWSEYNLNITEILRAKKADRTNILKKSLPKLQRSIDSILEETLTVMGKKATPVDLTKDTVQSIKQQIYNEKQGQIEKFASWFFGLLDKEAQSSKNINAFTSIARSAWNLYPHKELGDRSPVEIITNSPNEESRMWRKIFLP